MTHTHIQQKFWLATFNSVAILLFLPVPLSVKKQRLATSCVEDIKKRCKLYVSLSLIKFKRVCTIPSHREAGQATPLRLNRFLTDRVGGANGRKWRGVVVGGVTCTLYHGATDFSMIPQEKKKKQSNWFLF
jgi:hypothetical protein